MTAATSTTLDRLRREARSRRRGLSADERKAAGKRMTARAEGLDILAEPGRVAVYLALPEEAPTQDLIQRLRTADKALCVPAFDKTRKLYRWAVLPDQPDRLGPATFGVLEPVQPDWADDGEMRTVFVPGLAFDARGNRLGFGGGHYDRLLSRCPAAFRIGWAFACQVFSSLPSAPHDQPVDLLITEQVATPTGARPPLPDLARDSLSAGDEPALGIDSNL